MRRAHLLLLLAACSSDPEVPPVGSGHGQCVERSGSFRTAYTVRSGSCPPLPEAITNITPGATTESKCTSSVNNSPDNCEVTHESTCPVETEPSFSKINVRGHTKWSVDGSRGEGNEQWIVYRRDGSVLCNGTYATVIVRQ
jgi:hypothetical protein